MVRRVFLLMLAAIAVCGDYLYCPNRKITAKCPTEYDPVCGFRDIGEPATYINDCTACKDSRVIVYLPGACADNVNYCPSRRENCKLIREYNPSCAFE